MSSLRSSSYSYW